jgi:transcriptional regulator with XRE-family HTH domain
MTIGDVLKETRVKRKIKQKDVCVKVKISPTSLSLIENNVTTPSDKTLSKLCKLYKIPTQVVVWKSITEKDVQPNKREIFNQLSPAINNLIDEFFK